MRTSHARRPLHTQCELSRTNQGLLVAEMRFAAARAVTYAARRRHRRQNFLIGPRSCAQMGRSKNGEMGLPAGRCAAHCRSTSAPLRSGRVGRRQAIFGLMSLSAFPTIYMYIYEDNKLLASVVDWFIWLVWDRDQVYCYILLCPNVHKLVLPASW